MADLPQSVGDKWSEKVSPDGVGYASIFLACFRSGVLRHPGRFNFGVQVQMG
jgi:hypothetical protein